MSEQSLVAAPVARDDLRIAALAALAVGIQLLEAALPSPLPGLKPGFANIISVIVLCQLGFGAACWVSLLRVVAGSLLLGTFLGPSFVLSLAGALAALAALGFGTIFNRLIPILKLGPVGFCLLAATAHMTAQVLVAWILFIPHPGLLRLLPVFLLVALLTGMINGLISQRALEYIRKDPL